MVEFPSEQSMIDFLNRGLVISPWLAGIDTRGRVDEAAFFLLDEGAQEFINTAWTDELQTLAFGAMPVSSRMPRTAFYEIAASTAVWLAHEETGQPDVSRELTEQAMAMVRQFCSDYDPATLVQLYRVATQYENMQAISYYEEMSERNFTLGRLHRPWVEYSLSDELLLGVARGNYVIRAGEEQRLVSLTIQGQETFRRTEEWLEATGYLARRVRQLHLSRFNLLPNFHELAAVVMPDWVGHRQNFTQWLDLQPGMTVLELGCGDGVFTFEGGLAKAIGPSGRVVATDASRGMLNQAMKRNQECEWVTFQQARAEQLPFGDGAFDAVVGVSFLHFTQLEHALSEMRRMVKPGGIVGSFHPLPFSVDAPFFKEWFAPLIMLATKNDRERPKDFLTSGEGMVDAFHRAGLMAVTSEVVQKRALFWNVSAVMGFAAGVGWGQEELARIPWQARENVWAEIASRGEQACVTFPREDRVIQIPMQMLKGWAPKQECG